MFKRKTTKVRHRRQVKRLSAQVMSPRIFWYDLRRTMGGVFRWLVIAGLFAVAAWGVWSGVEKGLLKNDEFRLRTIALNPNPVIDEIRLLEVGGIDLSASLFQCDAGTIEARLKALPELAGAKVRRQFPGTLSVAVEPRSAVVWVSSEAQGVAPRDVATGLLVDGSGMAFPCQPGLLETAKGLPVIHLGEGGERLQSGERVVHPDFPRGLRLLSVARAATPEAEKWIDSISQYKAWASQMKTRDGMVAIFGHAELERQMNDFLAAVEHAREQGDKIARIQLIGKRNQPVILHEAAPPKAIPVEELPAPKPPEGNSDLNDLLER